MVSRLASKVWANRLKLLFLKIISENQSAFMNNHLITDNVLVAFETMHNISQKKKVERWGRLLSNLIWVRPMIGSNGGVWKKLC